MQQVTEQAEPNTYEWLIGALGGKSAGATLTMLARPSRAEPNLLIPLASRSVAAAALRRNHDDRSPKARVASQLGRSVAQMGLLAKASGDVLDFPSTAVTVALRRVMGDPNLQFSIGAGPPRRNRKPVIMMIRPSGEIAGFAKVGWSDLTRQLVHNEHDILTRIDGRQRPPIFTPSPLALIEEGDVVVSVCTAITARDWTRPIALTPEQIDAIPLQVHTRPVGDLDWLRDPRFGQRDDAVEQALEHAVLRVRERFRDRQLQVGLWHGDLNRWNMLSTSRGVGVIDWEFAGVDRPVGQDRRHLRFEALRRSVDYKHDELLARFAKSELAGASSVVELAVYFADLAIRESQLSGQGWDSAMAGFRKPLTTALEALLAGDS